MLVLINSKKFPTSKNPKIKRNYKKEITQKN